MLQVVGFFVEQVGNDMVFREPFRRVLNAHTVQLYNMRVIQSGQDCHFPFDIFGQNILA